MWVYRQRNSGIIWLENSLLTLLRVFYTYPAGFCSFNVSYVLSSYSAILIIIDLILILAEYYRGAAILGLFSIVPNVLKHRGWIHSLIAAIILPAPLLIIPIIAAGKLGYQQLGVSYYVAAVFGYMSHLVADRKGSKR